ncbi:MAG: hypothetical protein AAF417_10150 [Pseudomonadota bacterium]
MATLLKRALDRSFLLLVATVLVAACGGGDGTGSQNNAPPAPPAPPPPPPAAFNAVFSEIQAAVFTPTCATSGCHVGAGAPQGLQLDETNSFALLVGVASSEVRAVQRVAPGDPDNSYLIQKLEGTASVGQQMPLNGTPLPQNEIDTIRQWIIDGALDDRLPASSPIRVSSLSIVPDVSLATAPDQIIVGFDREPDASTVNASTVVLEASGGDGSFGDGNEVIVASPVSVPPANTLTAVIDLTGATLLDDTYQLSVLGAGPSILLDLDANALDGEFSGTFPSGDGSAGGDFVTGFLIQAPGSSGATLDDIQASVFTPSCGFGGCHDGSSGGLPGVLDLSDADSSFTNLVGVSSLQVPALLRVSANDPDNSYLVQKLEGTAAAGARMPFGGAPLDQNLIDDIREWIANGAQR